MSRRTCITCQEPTILAREVDNAIRIVDADPNPGGGLVLLGDVADQPTALWGVEPGERLPWGTVVPLDAARYQPHECASPVSPDLSGEERDGA